VNLAGRLSAWLTRHAQVGLSSLGQLSRAPVATLMTVLLIGVALALPAALYVAVANVRLVLAGWDRSTQVSVFLKREVDDRRAAALGDAVSRWPEVESVRVLTRAEALAEYRALSGLGDVVDGLESNPLPAVLLVRPRGGSVEAGSRTLTDRLAGLPEADGAQFDLQWVRRLQAIMGLGERAAGVLGAALGLAVLLVVANTTRVTIQGRRAEIEIARLFGATNAFVRRPFLYTGLWYGLLGGAAAWLCLAGVGLALGGPVAQLAELYGSDFRLQGLGADTAAVLVAGGGALGLSGAWLAVGRYLRALAP
jgi:cell division transport system permease protein